MGECHMYKYDICPSELHQLCMSKEDACAMIPRKPRHCGTKYVHALNIHLHARYTKFVHAKCWQIFMRVAFDNETCQIYICSRTEFGFYQTCDPRSECPYMQLRYNYVLVRRRISIRFSTPYKHIRHTKYVKIEVKAP
jgi:hypothetical protein